MATARARRTVQRRQRRKRVPPRRKPAGRAIPGTVFPIHEVIRVSNWRMLRKLNELHRQGKLHLMWQLSPGLKRRLGISNRLLKDHHWFVPMRLPSTQRVGVHGRSLIARLGNRYIFVKGSGAGEESMVKVSVVDPRTGKEMSGYGFGETFDSIEWPFRHRPGEDFHTRQLWGGSKVSVNIGVINVAETLRKKFRQMLKARDPVLRNALIEGIKEMPTLNPIALFKPRQRSVEYTVGHGRILNGEERASKREERRMREEFRSHLTTPEREGFDRRYDRAKKRAKERREVQKLVLKVADGKRHLNIPEEVLEQQAVLAYSVKSQFRFGEIIVRMPGDEKRTMRMRDLRAKLAFFNEATGGPPNRVAGGWRELFRLNGFELKFEPRPKSSDSGRFRIFRIDKKAKARREVDFETARREIVDRFVTTIGTGIYVMHKGGGGTFSQLMKDKELSVISSLGELNVSLAGEILDLDTAHFKGKKEDLAAEQRADRLQAQELIGLLIDSLWGEGEKGKAVFTREAVSELYSIIGGKRAGLY